jgi:hypothetical protein
LLKRKKNSIFKLAILMKKIVVLLLVFSLAAASPSLMAKKRRGPDLIIQKKDGQELAGELISIKRNSSLLLKIKNSGMDSIIDLNEVKTITIVKNSAALYGIMSGFLVGSVAGSLIVHYQHRGSEREKGRDTFIAGGIFGLLGAATGAVIGNISGKDRTILVEGMSLDKKTRFLEKLRRKARIPDS